MPVKFTKITSVIIILLIAGFLLLVFVLPGHSYIIRTSVFSNPISAAKLITASISRLTEDESDSDDIPQNILILGVPGKPNSAPYLTDTIIVARILENDANTSINTISIPRDLLVEHNGVWQRINALYVNGLAKSHKEGIKNIKTKVEEITELDITNYILIDTTALRELVNQVNGINVLVPKDIYDPKFPGLGNSYQLFEIKKGWRYLDGDMALKYARTRHSPGGDFGRMKRQIQVVRALKNKIFSLNPILNLPKFLKILKTVNNHIETDLGLFKIANLWNLSKKINTEGNHHVILDTSPNKNILKGAKMMLGNQEASVIIPVMGIENYRGIKDYIKTMINK